MKVIAKELTLQKDKRIICISDIHGNLSLFKKLLAKINYSKQDVLILIGDIYTKGNQCHETLKYIINLSKNENVHVMRGNCDWLDYYLLLSEKKWLNSLPHIIETDDYIFVHGGIDTFDFDNIDAMAYMKYDNFMDEEKDFDKFVITGHTPTVNYNHEIPCHNPIIHHEKHIISIDGGNVIVKSGQLNAFIIDENKFSYVSVDELPSVKILKDQSASSSSLNITWHDRKIELIKYGKEFSKYKHLSTNTTITLPTSYVWIDRNGDLCGANEGTNYFLEVAYGEFVSLVATFSDRILAKKDGVVGWVML